MKRLKPVSIVLVSVALFAALLGHVVIDILGDFMLAHDTYDDLGHSSRELVAIVTLALAALGIGYGLRAAISEARGNENALCAALRSALPRNVPVFIAGAIVVSMIVLCAMEGTDALLAGQAIDDLGDLFGGSVLLGGSVITIFAVAISIATLGGLRRLAQARTFVGVVVAFLRRYRNASPEQITRLERSHRLIFRARRICRRIAGRAPPFPSGATL